MRVKAQDHEFWADAQVLEGADYDDVWDKLVEDRAYYANYQSRTERKLPLVRLVELARSDKGNGEKRLMDIGDSPEEAAFRAEARAFLEQHAERRRRA